MCGICGIVSQDSADNSLPLNRMQTALEHRGPDAAGKYVEANVHLGVRRLSIIDIAGGQQPLYNEDRSLVLIANAEIYNFLELRSELSDRGHYFRTQSDCETILHLYEEHDTDCVQHLRGMFAFALWDIPRKRLLLARDRMGEKPLYLYESNKGLIFASELRALLQSGRVRFELDPAAIHLFFHYHYVPEPYTAIKGVRKLPAGHFLTIEPESWQLKEKSYWRMEDAPPMEGNPKQLIRDELDTISRIVIRSDVPIGVALSGGIDSSAITVLAAQYYPGTLHAFSVGYPGNPHYDERQDARLLAQHLKIPFHELELRTEEMTTFFPQLTVLKDDPIADISGYCYYSVMKLARDHGVPVMIQGQGGDELFWGYPWVRQAVEESIAKRKLLNGDSGFWDYLRAEGPWNGWKRFRSHKNFVDSVIFYDVTPDFQYAHDHVSGYYTTDFLQKLDSANPYKLFTLSQPWPSLEVLMTRLICQTYLSENGIAQSDRLSMASSVELRLPLCDYRLVEIVIGLRKAHSDLHLTPKKWLTEAVSDLLPDWVMQRRKRGFEPPVREWHNAIFQAHGSLLKDGYLVQSNILKADGADRLSKGIFPSGQANLSLDALVLEIWSRWFSSHLPS
jgi:asparagine synthase (glutamine-hydrolysing)